MRDESHASLEVIRIRVRLPFGEDNNFSPVYAFGLIVKYQMILETCTHIWVFCFVLFVYMSASVPIPNCIYCYSPILKSGMVIHLIFFFLIKIVWLFRAFSRVTCILRLFFYKKLF